MASEDESDEPEDVSGTGGNMGAGSEGVKKLAICHCDENIKGKTKSLFHAPVQHFALTNTSKLVTTATSKFNPMTRSKMHNFEFSTYDVCPILENSLLVMLKG